MLQNFQLYFRLDSTGLIVPRDPSLNYPTVDGSVINGVASNGKASRFYLQLKEVELHLFYIEVSEETVRMFKAKCAEEEQRTGATHGMSFLTKRIMTVQRPFATNTFNFDLPQPSQIMQKAYITFTSTADITAFASVAGIQAYTSVNGYEIPYQTFGDATAGLSQ